MLSLVVGALGLSALGYVVFTYAEAWMRYTPPWDDPAFYVAALLGMAEVTLAASWIRKRALFRGLIFSTLGILLLAACGMAVWYHHLFMKDCGPDAYAPNVFAPACPALPYTPAKTS
jgi:hypothetical protein